MGGVIASTEIVVEVGLAGEHLCNIIQPINGENEFTKIEKTKQIYG